MLFVNLGFPLLSSPKLPPVHQVGADRPPPPSSPTQLAPGGHVGRFCIWTKSAFEKLDKVFGTYTTASESKKGYTLPRSCMTNSDLTRLINSDEIQTVVRPQKDVGAKHK